MGKMIIRFLLLMPNHIKDKTGTSLSLAVQAYEYDKLHIDGLSQIRLRRRIWDKLIPVI
jgi:hypothetical protein